MQNAEKTGAAYIRVSTGKQEELSPDSQKRLILDYAKDNNIRIPPEFIFMENGISGRKADKRPQFQQMIALAKAKEFEVILLWKFSRFARNQEESIVYKSMLRKNGVEVVSISEPLADGPFGGLIERIIEWMDEFYSIRLSGDVTRGMTEKAMRGGYQCRPPLGYSIPYHNAVPEVVPQEAEIIRLIFDKYVQERMSLFALTRYLNSLGLKTAQGKPFEKRSLEYILQNPIYAGIVRWNRTCGETNELKAPSEWIIRPGRHPAIVSRELYEQAASRLLAESSRKNAKPAETSAHWLSGLLKCSRCGRTLSCCRRRLKSGKTSYSFQCYGYLKGKCSHNSYVSEKDIVPAVLKALEEVLEYGSIRYSLKSPEKKEDYDRTELLSCQLHKLEQKEKRAAEAYMEGIDTKEEYRKNKLLIQKERNTLAFSMQELAKQQETVGQDGEENEDALPAPDQIHTVLDLLSDSHFTTSQKNTALKSIVEQIIFDREQMHIDIYFSMTAPLASDQQNCPRTNTQPQSG